MENSHSNDKPEAENDILSNDPVIVDTEQTETTEQEKLFENDNKTESQQSDEINNDDQYVELEDAAKDITTNVETKQMNEINDAEQETVTNNKDDADTVQYQMENQDEIDPELEPLMTTKREKSEEVLNNNNNNEDECDEIKVDAVQQNEAEQANNDQDGCNENTVQNKTELATEKEYETKELELVNTENEDETHNKLEVTKAEIQILVENEDKDELETEEKSCFVKFIENFGKYLYIVMVLATLSLVFILIAFNEPDAKSGVIIGLVCFNMVLCGILMPMIGTLFIKAWRKQTWWIVFFVIYLALIVDTIAIATYIEELKVALILYAVVKILLIFQAFKFAAIDGKYFVPGIISGYITMEFIKQSKLVTLLWLYLVVLFIQIIMFSLGCMAFVIDENNNFDALFIIALILFIWLVNTPRHFLTYMNGRVLAYNLRKSEVEKLTDNDNIIKLAFKDTLNKFMTIVIGSFLITTTPIWYFITNLMTGVRLVTAGLICCCEPCSHKDEDDDKGNLISSLITCVSAITYMIAWIVRKLSKWTLRVTAKLILISAALLNITFWRAIQIQHKKISKESKETFGSDMLFLDNAITATNTHLCILISSIGCWLTYLIQPNAAIICWIAGYAACRTMFEMIDVILQTFLVAWFVEPRIIYEDKILFAEIKAKMEQMIKTLYPNEDDEFYTEILEELISVQVEQVAGLQKTTDSTHITNMEHTTTKIDAMRETAVAIDTNSGQVIAVKQNEAIMSNTETNQINSTDEIVNQSSIAYNNDNNNNTAISYEVNTQIR